MSRNQDCPNIPNNGGWTSVVEPFKITELQDLWKTGRTSKE